MTQHNAQHEHHNHFIAPVSLYVRTFVALLVLTVLTVAIAQVDFGSWNIIIAMAVAVTKASLVVLFFMGLKWDKKINAVFFVSSLLFLGIFLGYCLLDVNYRAQGDLIESQQFGLKSPVKLIKAEPKQHD
jgi:cytochrome c oxidase subunit IV